MKYPLPPEDKITSLYSKFQHEGVIINKTEGRSSRCNVCVSNKSRCTECRENPIYENVPTRSLFQAYIPTCPRGYVDCIHDPAYLKVFHPEYYQDLYGSLTPKQASEQTCSKLVLEDPDEEYYCYDDEDK